MNVKDIRRKNLRIIARAVGGITELSKLLNRSQSLLSHLIGKHPSKNIGDKFALIVETALNQPPGWLDQDQEGNIDFNHLLSKIFISPTKAVLTANTEHTAKSVKENLLSSIEENFATLAEVLFEKGKNEGLQFVAIRLLERGKRPLYISQITGLPRDKIKFLKEELVSKQNS